MAYKRRATGEGTTFRERKITRVICMECEGTMAASFFHHHIEISYGIVLTQTRGVDVGGGGLETYVVFFPRILKSVKYLVEGCPAQKNKPGSIREHFMYLHWKAKVVIVQEGPKTLPRCDQCRMNIPASRLFKQRHSNKCNKAKERRIRRKDVDMAARCGDTEFSLYKEEEEDLVEEVEKFKYLGRPLYQTDDD